MVSHLREEPGRVSVQVRRARWIGGINYSSDSVQVCIGGSTYSSASVQVRIGGSTCSSGSMFWNNQTETYVGVVAPHLGRQMASAAPLSCHSIFFHDRAL